MWVFASNKGRTVDDKDSHVHERLLRSDVPLRWKRNLHQQFHIAILMLETAVKYSAFHSGLCLIINDTPLLPQPPTDGGRVQTFSKVAYWMGKCISMWQLANLCLFFYCTSFIVPINWGYSLLSYFHSLMFFIHYSLFITQRVLLLDCLFFLLSLSLSLFSLSLSLACLGWLEDVTVHCDRRPQY